MKKFTKSAATLLVTTLVTQNLQGLTVHAAGFDQLHDSVNLLTLESLGVNSKQIRTIKQNLLNQLEAYAAFSQETDLQSLREQALAGLSILSESASMLSSQEVASIVSWIAQIRRMDPEFPVFSPADFQSAPHNSNPITKIDWPEMINRIGNLVESKAQADKEEALRKEEEEKKAAEKARLEQEQAAAAQAAARTVVRVPVVRQVTYTTYTPAPQPAAPVQTPVSSGEFEENSFEPMDAAPVQTTDPAGGAVQNFEAPAADSVQFNVEPLTVTTTDVTVEPAVATTGYDYTDIQVDPVAYSEPEPIAYTDITPEPTGMASAEVEEMPPAYEEMENERPEQTTTTTIVVEQEVVPAPVETPAPSVQTPSTSQTDSAGTSSSTNSAAESDSTASDSSASSNSSSSSNSSTDSPDPSTTQPSVSVPITGGVEELEDQFEELPDGSGSTADKPDQALPDQKDDPAADEPNIGSSPDEFPQPGDSFTPVDTPDIDVTLPGLPFESVDGELVYTGPASPSKNDFIQTDLPISTTYVTSVSNTSLISVRKLSKKINYRLKVEKMGTINLLPDFKDSRSWKLSGSPYNVPSLWGQCTWFAWGRFYELYGFSPRFYGNGYECVDQLLAVHGDKFKRSKKPASGAVFSSDYAHNHVGIVLDYDEEKDLLTIQEANLDGVSNPVWEDAIEDYRTIRLTSAQMRALYGDVVYAVPRSDTKFVTTSSSSPKKEEKQESGSISEGLKSLKALAKEKVKEKVFVSFDPVTPSKEDSSTADSSANSSKNDFTTGDEFDTFEDFD